jgi:hypothetical protein
MEEIMTATFEMIIAGSIIQIPDIGGLVMV